MEYERIENKMYFMSVSYVCFVSFWEGRNVRTQPGTHIYNKERKQEKSAAIKCEEASSIWPHKTD